MADYEKMYAILSDGLTKAVLILEEAQNKAAELCILPEESYSQRASECEEESISYGKRRLKQEPIFFD